MPAGLERDVQELYDYVNKLINTAESRGDLSECVDDNTCWTIRNRLISRVQKMMNKVLALEKIAKDNDQREYYSNIHDILNNMYQAIFRCPDEYDEDDEEEENCTTWSYILSSLMGIQGYLEVLMELLSQGDQGGRTLVFK